MFELRWVGIEEMVPNEWNPNQMDDEMYAKAIASIRRFGFVDPITVRQHGDGYEIIDGEHRWRAAADEGLKRVPIFDLGVVSDDDARQLTIVLNETRGQYNPQKLGNLLRDLSSRVRVDELLATLPFSREAFEQLSGMRHIDWSEMERPEMPKRQAATWVERIYRMPITSAEVLDQAMARWHEREDDGQNTTPDWQILEFLAADYLGS